MKPTIAVIGAGPGMGAAIAERFGREGFHVLLMARTVEKLVSLKQSLDTKSISCETVAVDVGDAAALKALLSALAEGHYLSVLAYNAASFDPKGAPSKLDPLAVSQAMQVSAISALVAAQAVLPKMRERGNGTLLFTGGVFAMEPMVPMSSLGMGKAALRNLAFSLFAELKRESIHAATVTICGLVKPGTSLDPAVIAEHYWQLHLQKPEEFERERLVK
jgi:short-subunit dehydrogenase